ncbi:asparaginase [Acetobacterium woodii]|uniref:L-asparaginase AnsA n=1 Tax=Acetobacterium woodii (strain ATCC 29683 / DSM 1030 / JCM 2381 / KCTC 1655 / WB1) TaxID=931626 RepID=H6LBX2_ACEWD|nr:asparaginase domain-containing protein [Acetobacterium woodii]AFA47715.1 L-asparaginase AnsA [Acetobacterium woodii DSM 1030]
MENAKILLLLTGGTIGSSVNDHCINVDASRGNDLLSIYRDQNKNEVEFEVVCPFNILSENAEPKHWLQIIKTLESYQLSDYLGVIIAHGSDTLPYTAAALCYGLDAPLIPIVLVAANYAIGEPDSNAITNFSASVDFIYNLKLPGFYAIYENSDHITYVHLASRLQEADWLKDDFSSFGEPFATYDQRGLCCTPSPKNPTMLKLYNPVTNDIPMIVEFRNEILALRAYPGLNYDVIDLRKRPVRAVLHSLYHCGSGNIIGENGTSLLAFIKNNPNVDHYLISYKNIHGDLYLSCQELIAAGGIPLENISFEAAVTKLNFAYNQHECSPQSYLNREFFYEFLKDAPVNGYVI